MSLVGEADRDQAESSFTRILRELLEGDPRYMAGIFVDREGECVDYCSNIDAFETKVAGAHLQVVLGEIRPALKRLILGEPELFVAYGTERDIVLRRVDHEYSLVLFAAAGAIDDGALEELAEVAEELRLEAGLEPPFFESHYGPLIVTVRDSVGFGFAPASARLAGVTLNITDVLGYFRESGGVAGGQLECFHVRAEDMREFLLVRDDASLRWLKLPLDL